MANRYTQSTEEIAGHAPLEQAVRTVGVPREKPGVAIILAFRVFSVFSPSGQLR